MNNIEIVDDTVELEVENASLMGTDVVWGEITGDIDDQTDLKNALDSKADDDEVVKLTGNQIIEGEKTFLGLASFAFIFADLENPLWIGYDENNKIGLLSDGFILGEKLLLLPTITEQTTIATLLDLSLKADDDSVVHNTGTESIDGEKSFIKKATFEDGIEVIGGTLQTNSFEIVETDTIVVDGENYSFGGVGGILATTNDLASKEDKSNKVVSLSASSTDTQYPSAKCVYDLIGDVESLLEAI